MDYEFYAFILFTNAIDCFLKSQISNFDLQDKIYFLHALYVHASMIKEDVYFEYNIIEGVMCGVMIELLMRIVLISL